MYCGLHTIHILLLLLIKGEFVYGLDCPIPAKSVEGTTHHWSCQLGTKQHCILQSEYFLEQQPQFVQFTYSSLVSIGGLRIEANIAGVAKPLKWLEGFEVMYSTGNSIWHYLNRGFKNRYGKFFSVKLGSQKRPSDIGMMGYDLHHYEGKENRKSIEVQFRQPFEAKKARFRPFINKKRMPQEGIVFTIRFYEPFKKCSGFAITDQCKDAHCDHLCENSKHGGYKCGCRNGFHLWVDEHTCVRSRHCGEGLYSMSSLKRCYYFSYNIKLSFNDASEFCQRKASKLAVVDHKETSAWMAEVLARLFNATDGTVDYWVGYISRDPQCSGGNWSWVHTGSKNRDVQTTVYAPHNLSKHESCNETNEKSCGFIGHNPSGKAGLYNDYCHEKKPYICEKETVNREDCPDTWFLNNNNCYWASSYHERESWHNAMSHCHRYFGSLLVLSSNEEWDFMKKALLIINKYKKDHLPVWAGAHYKEEYSSFTWLTGSPNFDHVAVMKKKTVPSWECGILVPAIKTNKNRFMTTKDFVKAKYKSKQNYYKFEKVVEELIKKRGYVTYGVFRSDNQERKDSFADAELTSPLKCIKKLWGDYNLNADKIKKLRTCIDNFIKAGLLITTDFGALTKCLSAVIEGKLISEVESCANASKCLKDHFWNYKHIISLHSDVLLKCLFKKVNQNYSDIQEFHELFRNQSKSKIAEPQRIEDYEGALQGIKLYSQLASITDENITACYHETVDSLGSIPRKPTKLEKRICFEKYAKDNEICRNTMSTNVDRQIDLCLQTHMEQLFKQTGNYDKFDNCIVNVIHNNRDSYGSSKKKNEVTECILDDLLPGHRCVSMFNRISPTSDNIEKLIQCMIDFVSSTVKIKPTGNTRECMRKTIVDGKSNSTEFGRRIKEENKENAIKRAGTVLRNLAMCFSDPESSPTLQSDEDAIAVATAIYHTDCNEKHHFICEKNEANMISNEPSYTFHLDPLSIHAAQGYCRDHNGNLVSIHSEEQFTILKKNLELEYTGDNWLIGLMDANGMKEYQYWIDDSLVDMTAWAPGYPKRSGVSCVVMSRREKWLWIDVSCEQEFNFICDKGSVHPMRLIDGYYKQDPKSIISSPYETFNSFASYFGNSVENIKLNSRAFMQSPDLSMSYGGGWKPMSGSNTTAYVEVHFEEEMVVQGIVVQGADSNKYYEMLTFAYDLNGYIAKLRAFRTVNDIAETSLIYTGNDLKQTSLIRIIGNKNPESVAPYGLRMEILAIPLKDVLHRMTHNYCKRIKHGCSHHCYNSRSSFICGCHSGYHLFSDGKACIPDSLCSQVSALDKNTCMVMKYSKKSFDEADKDCINHGASLATIDDAITNMRIKLHLQKKNNGCDKFMIGLSGRNLFNTRFKNTYWIKYADFAIFLEKSYAEDMVVYMSKSKHWQWDVALKSSLQACYICHIHHHDCFVSLTTGILAYDDEDKSKPVLQFDSISSPRSGDEHGPAESRIRPPVYNTFQIADDQNITLKIQLKELMTVTAILITGGDTDGIFNMRVHYSSENCPFSTATTDANVYTTYSESSLNFSKTLQLGIPVSSFSLYFFYKPFNASCVKLTFENPHYKQTTPIPGLALDLYGCPGKDKVGRHYYCDVNSSFLVHGGGHPPPRHIFGSLAYLNEKAHWTRCLINYDCTHKTKEHCRAYCLMNPKCKCRQSTQNKYFLTAPFDNCHVQTQCALSPCKNQANCTVRDDQYTCNCTRDFIGRNCTGKRLKKDDIFWYFSQPEPVEIFERDFVSIAIVFPNDIYDPTVSVDFGNDENRLKSQKFITLSRKHVNELGLRNVEEKHIDQWLGLFFTIQYNEAKTIALEVNISNIQSSVLDTRSLKVKKKRGCPLSLKITNMDSDIKNARPFVESIVVTFQAKMDMECKGAHVNKIEWKWIVGKLEPKEVFVNERVNVITLPSTIPTNTSSLTITPWALPASMYYIFLRLQMKIEGYADSSEKKYGYLNITNAPVTLSFQGGIERELVIHNALQLSVNVTDQTQNPIPEKFITLYEWYCNSKGARKICDFSYKMWPGDLKNRTILPVKGSQCLIKPNMLIKDTDYKFTVKVVLKSGRELYANQIIKSKDNAIPIMGIECLSNCGSCSFCVSPVRKIALAAKCFNCPLMSDLKLTWEILRKTGDMKYTQLTINWEKATATKYNQQTLVIRPNIFYASNTYIAKITGLSKDGLKGVAKIELQMAKHPIAGTCHSIPKSGESLVTNFVIQCQGFKDSQGMLLLYIVSLEQVTNKEKSRMVMYHGYTMPSTEFLMTEGNEANNYTLNITVHVETVYGLYLDTIVPIQVRPMIDPNATADVAIGNLENLIDKEDNPIDKKLSVNDNEGAVQAISAFMDTLNKAGDKMNVNQTDNSTLQKSQKLRAKMLTAMASVEVKDVAMVQKVALANSLITKNSNELTEDSANQALGNIATICKQFKNLSKQGSDNQGVEVAGYLVQGLSSLMRRDIKTDDKGKLPPTVDKEKERSKSGSLLRSFDSLASGVHSNQIPQEGAVHIDTQVVKMALEKKYFYGLAGSKSSEQELIGSTGETLGSKFIFPPVESFYDEDPRYKVTDVNQIISIQSVLTNYDLYAFGNKSSNISSPIVKFDVKSQDNKDVALNDLNEPVEFFISVDKSKEVGDISHRNITVQVVYDPTTNVTHKLMWIPTNENFSLTDTHGTIIILRIQHSSIKFRVAVKQGTTAKSQDEISVDYIEKYGYDLLPEDNEQSFMEYEDEKSFTEYVISVSKDRMKSNVYYGYFALVPRDKQKLDLEVLGPGMCMEHTDQCRWKYVNVTLDMRIEGKSCLFWDDKTETWLGEGCRVGNQTTVKQVHCQCDHLSSFTSGFLVMPNYVNPLEITLFLTFFDNPVVVMMILLVWMVYLMMIIIMRHMDKIDQTKSDIRIIEESKEPTHTYIIGVFTGWWRNSGTTANVCFYLTGTAGRSMRHGLQDIERPRFESGDEDWFLLRTSRPLGTLQYITFWHDSFGEKPRWFLKEAIVKDLESNETYTFVYNEWLAVDRGSYSTIATIPAFTSTEICSNHKYQFWLNAVTQLRDGHIWLSIFVKPLYSTFTRVQRLSCGMTLLLTAMLTSIMFFGIPTDDPADQVSARGFQFSLSSLAIGIQTAIIMFPISILTITLFTKVKPRKESKPHRADHISATSSATAKLFTGEDYEMPKTLSKSVKKNLSNNADAKCILESDCGGDNNESANKSNNARNISNNADPAPDLYNDPCHARRQKKDKPSRSPGHHKSRSTPKKDLLELPAGQKRRRHARKPASKQKPQEQTTKSRSKSKIKSKSRSRRHSRTSDSIDAEAVARLTKAHSERMQATLEQMIKETQQLEKPKPPKRDFRLPWYFVYVAWSVCLGASLVCSYFVMLYGLKFGYNKSLEWVVAFLTSFFTSNGLTQPLKVIIIALVITMILRKTASQATEQVDIEKARAPGEDKNYHDGIMASFQPLTTEQLSQLKDRIVKHWQMNDLIRELFFYFTFIAVVIIAVAGQRDITSCFRASESIKNMYCLESTADEVSVMTVQTTEDMWSVLTNVVYPNMYAKSQRDDSHGIKRKKYRDKFKHKLLTADEVSIVVGLSRIRQVRVNNYTCPQYRKGLPEICEDSFNYRSEDIDSYTKGWNEKLKRRPIDATRWTYQTAWKTKTPPFYGDHGFYSGGGYSIDIPNDPKLWFRFLRGLQNSNWIDGRTRAVFVDFTTYNPSMNLCTLVTLVFEIPQTGVISPKARIFTSKLYPYRTQFEKFTIFVQAVFILYTLIFGVTQYKRYKRLGRKLYFSDVWNVIEFIIIIASCISVGIFFQRLMSIKKLIKTIKESHGLKYVSFYTMAGWDYALSYIMAVLVFLVILKLFKMFRFNVKMSMLTKTIKLTFVPLSSFLIVAFIVVMAFAHFGVLIFGRFLRSYRDFSTSSLTLLNFALGVSEYYELESVDKTIGPLYFFLFVFFVQTVILSILVTIILESFAMVQSDLTKVKNEFELVQYMASQLCLLFGIDYSFQTVGVSSQKKKQP